MVGLLNTEAREIFLFGHSAPREIVAMILPRSLDRTASHVRRDMVGSQELV